MLLSLWTLYMKGRDHREVAGVENRIGKGLCFLVERSLNVLTHWKGETDYRGERVLDESGDSGYLSVMVNFRCPLQRVRGGPDSW